MANRGFGAVFVRTKDESELNSLQYFVGRIHSFPSLPFTDVSTVAISC